jgi:hypothetical protein
MPISEAARNDLYTGLTEVLGQARTETLMSVIRLNDLDEVASKSDIAFLRSELDGLRSEFDGLRSEFDGLRSEFGALTVVVGRIDQKLDRLILVLMAGLFAVIATLVGVGLTL